MPPHVRKIGRYGNGLAAVLLGLLCLFGWSSPKSAGVMAPVLALFALAVFNVYVLEKAAWLLSEEEWLKAELRKAELRQKLAAMAGRQVLPALEQIPETEPKSN